MLSQNPRSILVTGGSGFVGSTVIDKLVERGHRVIATTTTRGAALPHVANLTWLGWDAMERTLPDVDWAALDTILHLANPTSAQSFPEQAAIMYRVNVSATFELLEMARKQGIRRVVIASTGDVLGHARRPAREDDIRYRPSSFYGTAKACAELLARSYQSVLGSATLRFYHPYGPGGERFLVNRLLRAVSKGQEVSLEGLAGIRLNPVWIDDLADGVCLALESDLNGNFHFAGPETVTLRQLIEVIGSIVGVQPVIRVQPTAPVERHSASFLTTRRLLGYRPKVGVSEGLARLWSATAAD